MSAFTRHGITFAAKCTLAAIGAILTALWLDLPYAGWAGLTVFLVSQPLAAASGAVISRSGFRLLGSLIGVAGALAIIPAVSGNPVLLIACVAMWTAACLYVSLVMRGPHAYALLLAGYTLPLVGLPLAGDPGLLFEQAIVRVLEVGLGGAFAIVVHALIAPRSMAPMLRAKLDAAVANAGECISGALGTSEATTDGRQARLRLASNLAEVRNLGSMWSFQPDATSARVASLLALEQRMLHALALSAHVEHQRGQLPIAELQQAWRDIVALASRFNGREDVGDPRIDTLVAQATKRRLHVDHGIAARSGLAAAVSVILTSFLLWLLGWQHASFAIGIAAAGSSLFAFLDDPRPILRQLLTWTLASIPIAALYVFAVLPAVDGRVALAIALAPLFFVTALYMATPNRWVAALSVALVTQTLIQLQPGLSGDLPSFATASLAVLLATLVVLTVISLMRVVSVDTSVSRLLQASRRDIDALAADDGRLDRDRWTSVMADRLALLAPRIGRASDALKAQAASLVDEIRLGAPPPAKREGEMP